MSEINLPPFYVGQKVIAVRDVKGGGPVKTLFAKKGQEFTVIGNKKCCKWLVDVGLTTDIPRKCAHCDFICDSTLWCNASLFVPSNENFQSISLEKVIEQEKKLVGAN